MKKFVIEVTEGQQFTAGSKAKQDVVTFLEQENYKKISIHIPTNKIFRVITGLHIWKGALKEISSGDLIVYQYPAYSRIIGDFFLKQIQHVDCTKVILLHDLDSLRIYKNSPKDIKRELNFLNQFDFIICHNDVMKKWLLDHQIDKPVYSLKIFDYDENLPLQSIEKDNPVVFAGNLAKSKFLTKLDMDTKFDIFGVSPSDRYPKNVLYKGAFPPDELGEHLIGSFGLVWDGDALEGCSGVTGEYMRYNNPHKTSLYLTLGIPVIIWDRAALSGFVRENNVGITVSNLNELDELVKILPESKYRIMQENAKLMSSKLRSGYFIKDVLQRIIKDI